MDRLLSATEYRLLVEHSPVMIWRSGLDAKCDYFNGTWLQFTGRTLQQETGDGWAEGVHPEDFDRCVAHYLGHFERREPFEMEYRLRRSDGEYRWIFDRGVPFTDDTGAFAGYIGSCVDVHARRLAQDAEARQREKQLALARDFEQWMVSVVSHEIGDPLHNVALSAQLMARLSVMDGPAWRQAHATVERVQHVVGNLVDLSREREPAGMPVNPRPTDLGPLCQRIVDHLSTITMDRHLKFECEADGHGIWDEARVVRAISNLASNAVEHGTPGTPVTVRLTGDDLRVVVEVRNHGRIPDELMPRLFEPFRTGRLHGGLDRGGPDQGGLGLGLFIARAIAAVHGGELEVHSADELTTFRLVLPRRHGAAAMAPV
jgi:two-component system CheB/CheR fusion protein